MATKRFERRTLQATLHDVALPAAISAKDVISPVTLAQARCCENFFNEMISASFAGAARRKKNSVVIPTDSSAPGNASDLGFPLVPLPARGDWLDEHHEAGQSMDQFIKRSCQYAKPHGPFDTIALVIIGEDGFPPALVLQLREYISAFFLLRVEVVGPLSIDSGDGKAIRRRQHPDTGLQLFASDCLDVARKTIIKNRELSRRVVATMGITMLDLTKNEEWNFLYGLASPMDSAGCFSMCRFAPSFNNERVSSSEEAEKLILQRCCKVVTHELTHIFGVKHCVHFQCLMNGANHCGELHRQPLIECPVCCAKLTVQLGWDLPRRYEALASKMHLMGFEQEALFVQTFLLPKITQLRTQPQAAEVAEGERKSVGAPRRSRSIK